ncbi:MAG: nitroreductase family protein [Eubacteriales bacterium]|nr:nitroreductase family protein [Eubacteriales bacterium]
MASNWRLNGFYDSTKLTGLFESAQRRESCRSFTAAPTVEQWNALLSAADTFAMPGVRIALGICDNSLFQPVLGSLFVKFENVQRFAAVIVTDPQPRSEVNAGVSGEMFLLRAVELGLGACWVSGTYKRGQVGIQTKGEEKIAALIALGRPKAQPVPPLKRKRKELKASCPDLDELNSAFKEIARYVQIAPSGMNLQPWRVNRVNDHAITVSVGMPMQRLDLGIAMCHALLALGSTPAAFTLSDNGQTATIELL